MEPKSDTYKPYLVDGYNNVTMDDLAEISRVNFRLAAGITTGLRNFRANFQYQYAVTNILNKLNDRGFSC